jgi:4-hydroxy-2-oxoglutarate aldolase
MTKSMAGAYAPITTPFTAAGEVAYDRLTENVAKWAQTPLTGLVVLGSNGEGVFLTEAERRKVLETVRAVLPQNKIMIVGTGCESTYATAKQNEIAAHVGADAVLVITPNYYRSKMDGPAMVRHYTSLADQSALPVFIYNMPGNTGIDLSAETILEIAQHPNVIGVKDSSGNVVKMGVVIASAPAHFKVYAGSASFLYPGVALGAVGGVMALANIAPDLCAQLYTLSAGGQHEAARDLQLKLIPLNTAVTAGFGIAALKQGLDWIGYYGGPVRSPLGPLNEAQTARLRELMVNLAVLSR